MQGRDGNRNGLRKSLDTRDEHRDGLKETWKSWKSLERRAGLTCAVTFQSDSVPRAGEA